MNWIVLMAGATPLALSGCSQKEAPVAGDTSCASRLSYAGPIQTADHPALAGAGGVSAEMALSPEQVKRG